MDRRTLLRNLLAGVPAGLLLPSFFAGCKDEDFIPANPFRGKVIIIGAGAAGIYAAYLLKKQGVSVSILEATERAGGRMYADSSFADVPIELGAEQIHGNNSLLVDLIKFIAPDKLADIPGGDLYWLENQLRTESYLNDSAALEGAGATMLQLVESLGSYTGPNVTVSEYLNSISAGSAAPILDPRFIQIANALIGNEYGSDNDRVGMLALQEAEAKYSSGTEDYVLRSGSYWNIFESAFPDEINQVEFSKPVTAIDYSGSSVVVTAGGSNYTADRVLITVPLGVLKEGSIAFTPALPAPKLDAISSIGMGAGMKIFLKFSTPFWNPGTASIIGGTKVPEYWVTAAAKNTAQFMLTAFVMGARAEYLAGLSDNQIKEELFAELSTIFGGADVAGKFTSMKIQNWSAEPYTKGAYSFPTLTSSGKPELLSQALNGKLFFAGEATNFNGHQATVHGAMESSFRSAKEILES
jgi:monoamine oxidase